MSIEIEREKTYLASRLPSGLEEAHSVLIRDIYIPENAPHAHLRLRQKGGIYEATKKTPISGSDSSRQTEHTIPLTREEFEALASCSGRIVQKRRYSIKIEGHEAEVDVFEEKLAGLVLIDFEFTSDEALSTFGQPEVAIADVTQDEVVAGGFLAGKSYEDIEGALRIYNYERITV